MTPIEIIAIITIVASVGGASAYIIKQKRSGKKCIGCPYADACADKCNCNIENK